MRLFTLLQCHAIGAVDPSPRLHGTTVWLSAGVLAAYVLFAIIGARHIWNRALQTRGFLIRSVDGSWSKGALTIKRAEAVALGAAERAPLEIVDSGGRVIGTVSFDAETKPAAGKQVVTER